MSRCVGQHLRRKTTAARKRMKYSGSDKNFVMVGRERVKG